MGYMPDPAYCLWVAHLGNRFIAFKEKLWFKHIASDIAKDIVGESEGMNVAMTFCDPTISINTGADVQTIKDTFEMNGVPMECSVNNREHYAHFVHTALAEEAEPGIPRLQIFAKGCPYLIKTLPMQRYDPKHPLKMAEHKDDHAVVALAYFLISSSSLEHRAMTPSVTPKRWLLPKVDKSWTLGHDNVRDPRR